MIQNAYYITRVLERLMGKGYVDHVRQTPLSELRREIESKPERPMEIKCTPAEREYFLSAEEVNRTVDAALWRRIRA